MGKCKCGKALLGRRRKCGSCKNKKKDKNIDKIDILLNDLDINSSDNETYSNNEDNFTVNDENEEERGENDREFSFIENFFINNLEIDSIYMKLNKDNICSCDANLTVYSSPKIFHVKNCAWFKYGWINYIDTGFQCNILSKYELNWQEKYQNVILKLKDKNITDFLPILPNNIDKVVYYVNIHEFLISLVQEFEKDIIFYGKGLKSIVNSRNIGFLLNSFSKTTPDNNSRIDFASTFYDKKYYKFNIDKLKGYLSNLDGVEIVYWRTFTKQYGECTSLIAKIRKYGNEIGGFRKSRL